MTTAAMTSSASPPNTYVDVLDDFCGVYFDDLVVLADPDDFGDFGDDGVEAFTENTVSRSTDNGLRNPLRNRVRFANACW